MSFSPSTISTSSSCSASDVSPTDSIFLCTARKAFAFLQRDFRIETSYKFQFLWSFATIFFTVTTFYFVSKLVLPRGEGDLFARYPGGYFSFVVVGLAIAQYLEGSLSGTTTAIRQAMNQGTLEMIFVTPTHPMTILVFSALWQFLFETVRIVFCFGLAFLFGFRLPNANWSAALLALALTVPAFMCIGVLSSSLLLLLKRGDPINWFAVGFATLLSGVMFPVELLPSVLRWVGYIIPLTHSLNCVRGALLQGLGMRSLWPHFVPLALFSAVMLPVALMVSQKVLRHAKRTGALGAF